MSYKNLSILSAVILSAILILAGTVTHWQLRKMHLSELQTSLQTVLNTSHQSLKSWATAKQRAAQSIAKDTLVSSLSEQLIAEEQAGARNLLQHRLINHLRPSDTLGGSESRDNRGFMIIDKTNRVLSSDHQALIGMPAPKSLGNHFLPRVLGGFSPINQPTKSQIPLFDKFGDKRTGVATMFVGAPILDAANQTIAAYVQRIDVTADFVPLFNSSRIGRTGETYAFNNLGLLISESRYDQQLQAAGLIAKNERALLNLVLRDPGSNLLTENTQLGKKLRALTIMVARATRGENGQNLDGYRDYRGVEVIGSWIWDHNLQMGIAVEMDRDEATELHRISIRIIWALILFSVMVLNTLITFHVRARNRYRTISRLQKAILDNSTAPILIKNRSGVTLLSNLASQTARNTASTQHSPDKPENIFEDNNSDTIQKYDNIVLDTQAPVEFEVQVNTGDQEITYWMVKFPIKNQHNYTYAIGTIATEITSRREAEKEVKERERFMVSLMSNLPGFVYRFNPDDRMSANYMSQGCFELSGYHPSDFIDQTHGNLKPTQLISEIIIESDRKQVQTIRREAFKDKKTYELEYRIKTAKGDEKWVWERGRGTFDTEGKLAFTEGFVTEITDRKRIDKELSAHRKHLARLVKERTQELEQERAQLNNIVTHAADGICTFDSSGTITLMNPAALRITEYNLKELVGIPFSELLDTTDREFVLNKIDTLRVNPSHSQAGLRLSVKLRSKQGHTIKTQLAISRSLQEQMSHFTVIIQELDEKKRPT